MDNLNESHDAFDTEMSQAYEAGYNYAADTIEDDDDILCGDEALKSAYKGGLFDDDSELLFNSWKEGYVKFVNKFLEIDHAMDYDSDYIHESKTDWNSFFDKLTENDESIYAAHEEFKKDQEQKKEEDDNQENLTFDEGSVKLTTVKESKEEDTAMFMSYINNIFDDTGHENIGTCPDCGMTITDEDELEDGTHECPKCGSILEDHEDNYIDQDFWDIEDDE